MHISQVQTEIANTKTALNFLQFVNISSHNVSTPTVGTLASAQATVNNLEWQIGQLEMACFTNFTTNRTAQNTTNFTNFGSATTAYQTVNSTNKTSNHTTDCSFVFSNFHACDAVYNSFYNGKYAPFFTPHNSNFFGTQHNTFRSGFYSTYRHYVNTSFHSGHGCVTFGSNYSPKQKTNHGTFKGNNFASFVGGGWSNWCGIDCTGTVFATQSSCPSNFMSVNSTQFVAQSNCSTVFSAQNSAFFADHNVTVNATNFSATTATYYANWGTFQVSPLN